MLNFMLLSPAKPSRPSRAYLYLTKPEHINALSDRVRSTTFVDAKASTRDISLLGPPSVEFAPYGRIPNGRPRKDGRQGTIDQDPEFIDFLESLTNPVIKPQKPADQENDGIKGQEKVIVTPLVQFLKDKKANKGKESVAAKNAKQARLEKETKAAAAKENAQTAQSPKKKSAQAVKVEQAARDAVKALNQHVVNAKAPTAPPAAPKAQAVSPPVAPNSTATSALASKQRERGNASAAARILQRDLGIGGNPRGRAGRLGAAPGPARHVPNNQAPTKTASPSVAPATAGAPIEATTATDPDTPSMTTNPSSETQKSASTQPPTGPAAARTQPPRSTSTAPPQQTPAINKATPAASTSTQAFLKHANPSQGITEPLLEEAFKPFGAISKVEIDKKKGFAYVDFTEAESLQRAIKASPVKVAQGSVQVLERKTGSTLQARNNARGNNNAMVNSGNPHRGGGGPMQHPPRGGPMMNARGGMNNRGGGVGGVGGANIAASRGNMRGRGGMARGGGGHVASANKATPAQQASGAASSATSNQEPQPPTAAASTTESSRG